MYNFNIKQKPISSLIGMGGGIGGFVFGGGGGGIAVDDIFNMKLYTGAYNANGDPGNGDQDIDNGMNLDVQNGSPGGLVVLRDRPYWNGGHWSVYDTDRGAKKYLIWGTDGSQQDTTLWGNYDLYAFNDNGFSLGDNNLWTNNLNHSHIAYTFMKSEKFFDICTWSGQQGNTDQTIPHSLGCEPGMIITKNITSGTTDWWVYHTSLSNQNYIRFNSSAGSNGNTGQNLWNPTSTSFKAANYMNLNTNGQDYVAYLFAEDEDNIKCGSYVGTGDSISNGGSSDNSVNVGFKPQFILIKRDSSSYSSDWFFFDTSRGINSNSGGNDAAMTCPTYGPEYTTHDYLKLTSNGFDITTYVDDVNHLNDTYIYVAIKEP